MAVIGYTPGMDNDLDLRAYVRMAARLRRQISRGTYAPAAPVPSITVLREQYGHARQTCAKAFQVLAGEGLLVRIPGPGYHVAQHP
jgi:GntR family histidine utilization transcriptional repressor